MGTDIPSHGIGEPNLDQEDFKALKQYWRGGIHSIEVANFIQMDESYKPVAYDKARAIRLMREARERFGNGETTDDPDNWYHDRISQEMGEQ